MIDEIAAGAWHAREMQRPGSSVPTLQFGLEGHDEAADKYKLITGDIRGGPCPLGRTAMLAPTVKQGITWVRGTFPRASATHARRWRRRTVSLPGRRTSCS